MGRDPRYDILFEPVRIGPVTAKNRFFQVPHCNGMGHRDPSAHAAMRGMKAEGGWAVVCTEETEIHHSSDVTPSIELRLWDERDIPALARLTDAVHAHDALAGIELCHNGRNAANLTSREAPLAPAHLPIASRDPIQARRMDKQDIANLRRWHRQAALRARSAGFDLVYVYAGHALSLLHHFLSRGINDRDDDYGGALENRVRLLREVIEDTKEAVGETCAVALRISLDELRGEAGLHRAEMMEVVGLLAELPDLWDFCLASWENDSQTSRFSPEAAQEPYIEGFKQLTTKPVVGVGRFTSPDTMVRQIKSGLMDLIGAARPSIADPFLPKKIEQGRLEEIRECIGCNICVSGDFTMAPIRCTQNPTMGEEWRRGWHPERIRPKESEAKVLVVGAGPAGLECVRALGQRGYAVTLAEAGTELGGRVALESRLPGLAAWGRVRDHRAQMIGQMANVEVYYDSELSADDVLAFGFEQVVLATGCAWRRDGVARQHLRPMPIDPALEVLTPDDLMAGRRPKAGPGGDPVVLFDDDHYYMGSVLAELLVADGYAVHLVTTAALVADWTQNTMEQTRIQTRMLELGVTLHPHKALERLEASEARLSCVFTGRESRLPCGAALLVTARLPNEALYLDLKARADAWPDAGILGVTAIGDAWAPSTIAAAVHAGRKYAEGLDGPPETGDSPPFRRERAELTPMA